ncbi:N-acetyl-gamma-glutamyl-phosphate reductase [Glaciecola petra]|uniref:N-acetyl-gamma-glutamyl-phosphate reductase n=1 Tax=Glaciecola petra TaxID=3075602 RepID=A0ABU2ZSA9_9ALTE|nr:N-acetyl-gamma-glutamyl-phosphate reductase [Aestuariibacter sp. P117]MDT0595518.1 N-acetyl-gamma-glutamyl-phosphate reductase [Aestuariibacter sp. P117]
MNKTCIIGASGYTGAELIKLINRHPILELRACYVSEHSNFAGKTLAQVHEQLSGDDKLAQLGTMIAFNESMLDNIANEFDHIFLATPHEFSHDYLPSLLNGQANVYDLSGAFRLTNPQIFETYYGFEHKHHNALKQAVYGLAEWHAQLIQNAKFIAVPGCYPTASLLALKPLISANLLANNSLPVINATSGVSGAGRKASVTTSFQEVSLQAYGVLQHRHMPEIEEYANQQVVFTPHLGAFKRGILATLTCFLKPSVSLEDIDNAYNRAYQNQPLIRLLPTMPKLDNVVHTPYCDIAYVYSAEKNCIVVTSAIDNLLKGAASQAIQCCNLKMGDIQGITQETGLI